MTVTVTVLLMFLGFKNQPVYFIVWPFIRPIAPFESLLLLIIFKKANIYEVYKKKNPK